MPRMLSHLARYCPLAELGCIIDFQRTKKVAMQRLLRLEAPPVNKRNKKR